MIIKLSICMRAVAFRIEANSSAASGSVWKRKNRGLADRTIRLKCLLLGSGCAPHGLPFRNIYALLSLSSVPLFSFHLCARGQSAKGAYRTSLKMIFRWKASGWPLALVSDFFWMSAFQAGLLNWLIMQLLSLNTGAWISPIALGLLIIFCSKRLDQHAIILEIFLEIWQDWASH